MPDGQRSGTKTGVIIATLHDQVAKTRTSTIDGAQNLIQPAASILRLLAGMVASDPSLFRTERSRESLYRALTSAELVNAVYVTVEGGYHRVVTRMDENRRRSELKIPPTALALWYSSYIDAFSARAHRRRHRVFFDTGPHLVGQYAVEPTVESRTLPSLQGGQGEGIADGDGPVDQSRYRVPGTGTLDFLSDGVLGRGHPSGQAPCSGREFRDTLVVHAVPGVTAGAGGWRSRDWVFPSSSAHQGAGRLPRP